MSKRPKKIKPMMLVKFDYDNMPVGYHKHYPFSESESFVYLGDIVQMPGHCVVVSTKTGRVYCCYHTDEFVVLNDEEV